MTILNRLGHAFDDNRRKIAVPVKTVVSKNRNGFRERDGKPVLRVTPGMNMREFYKVRADGEVVAYTPKAANRNPACPNTFLLGLYKSPTGVFIPKNIREKRDDQ